MLTLKEFMNYRNSFNSETAYGEPQHWIYLKTGRSIEITHEEYGLSRKEQMFLIRYHCSEKEYDDGDFQSTNGIIDIFSYVEPSRALQCVYNIMQAYHEKEDDEDMSNAEIKKKSL